MKTSRLAGFTGVNPQTPHRHSPSRHLSGAKMIAGEKGVRERHLEENGEEPLIKGREGDTGERKGFPLVSLHRKTGKNSKETKTAGRGKERGRKGVSLLSVEGFHTFKGSDIYI